jgi:hypothetical protein
MRVTTDHHNFPKHWVQYASPRHGWHTACRLLPPPMVQQTRQRSVRNLELCCQVCQRQLQAWKDGCFA